MLEVRVKVHVLGVHRWSAAPAWRPYLRENHQHEFEIQVGRVVHHGDREIEFHDLRELVTTTLFSEFQDGHRAGVLIFGERSCEHIAEWLLERLPIDWALVQEEGAVGGYASRRILTEGAKKPDDSSTG